MRWAEERGQRREAWEGPQRQWNREAVTQQRARCGMVWEEEYAAEASAGQRLVLG